MLIKHMCIPVRNRSPGNAYKNCMSWDFMFVPENFHHRPDRWASTTRHDFLSPSTPSPC